MSDFVNILLEYITLEFPARRVFLALFLAFDYNNIYSVLKECPTHMRQLSSCCQQEREKKMYMLRHESIYTLLRGSYQAILRFQEKHSIKALFYINFEDYIAF